jgi:hypothetical protein
MGGSNASGVDFIALPMVLFVEARHLNADRMLIWIASNTQRLSIEEGQIFSICIQRREGYYG